MPKTSLYLAAPCYAGVAQAETAFAPEEVFALLASGCQVAQAGGADEGRARLLLIARQALDRIRAAFPGLQASIGDVRNGAAAAAAMVFESTIDPVDGRYRADLDAFLRRWHDLGGELWTAPPEGASATPRLA
jgi:hypothetical protein